MQILEIKVLPKFIYKTILMTEVEISFLSQIVTENFLLIEMEHSGAM